MAMTSSRPYVVRALHEWILQNNCTPYVLVDAMATDTLVPQQYVKDGRIVLDISPAAVTELLLTNESIQFTGRFDGVSMDVFVPMSAVMGIYARENGQGMVFDLEEDQSSRVAPTKETGVNSQKKPSKKSSRKKTSAAHLKVVK